MATFVRNVSTVDAVQWLKHGDHHLITEVPASSSLWDAAGGQLAPHYGYFHGGHGVPAMIVTPGSYIVTDKNDVTTIWNKDEFESLYQEVKDDTPNSVLSAMQDAHASSADRPGVTPTLAQCSAMLKAALEALGGHT